MQPSAINVNVDINALSVDELELFEETTGVTLSELAARPSVRGVRGLIWIVRRRTEPNLSFDDLRSMTVPELTAWSVRIQAELEKTGPLVDEAG